MRQYVIDCTGDTPSVVSWQRSKPLNVDFGMAGGDYNPPNSLRLDSGTLVLAANLNGNSTIGIAVHCYDPTSGNLLSETWLQGNTFLSAMLRHPTDPNAIVVVGDNELWEVVGLDTATPTATMRTLVGQPNPYPSGSTSPYYRGPGILDTGVDQHDQSGPLYGYDLISGSRSLVADIDWDTYWPNGSFELAPGKVITALYGMTNAENAANNTASTYDSYARLVYVDYTDPANVIAQVADVKPALIHPDAANVPAGTFLNIDELNVGSTSLSAQPSSGTIVRGSTFLTQHYLPNGTLDGGSNMYCVGVWRLLASSAKPTDAVPPLEDRVPFTQEYLGDPLPFAEEDFITWTTDNSLPNNQSQSVWTPVAPDGTVNLVVGTSPVLTTNDDDAGYLQRIVDTTMRGDAMMGARVAPTTLADTDTRTLTAIQIKIRYEYQPAAGGYGYGQSFATRHDGTLTYRRYGTTDFWVGNSLTDGPGWKDDTFRITASDSVKALIAAGQFMAGSRATANGYAVDYRLSYVEVRPVYVGPPA